MDRRTIAARRRRGALRLRCGVAALVVLATACAGTGVPKDSASSGPALAASRRPLAIAERNEEFVDRNRSTDAVGTTPAAPYRSLPSLIIAPTPDQAGRPYPLIVFAHGNGGTNRSDIGLQRGWAAAGYVVVSPTFPFGASRAPDQATGAMDAVNQPGDMTFLVNEVLRLAADASDPLHGVVDPHRIGVAGHSLGGSTALGLAGNTCCHDERVKAAVVLAGGELLAGAGDFWTKPIRTPMLYVHGNDVAGLQRLPIDADVAGVARLASEH